MPTIRHKMATGSLVWAETANSPLNACNFENKYLLLKSKIIAKLSRILQKNVCIPNKLNKTAKFNEKRCEANIETNGIIYID